MGPNTNTMLALLLIEEDAVADSAIATLMAEDIYTIRYRDPLRLLDALQELRPDALIIHRRDFPLHAQMIAGYARFCGPLSRCRTIVIGDGGDAPKQSTVLREELILQQPSSLLAGVRGAAHAPGHRGSRLVAKAQRIMKE